MSLPPLSSHLGYLFNEYDLADRIAASAKAGFDAVEFPQPYAIPAPEMARLLRDNGLFYAQMAASPGVAARGEKGLACLPGREADFRDGVAKAMDYAGQIGCRLVHPTAGVLPADTDRATAWGVYVENLAKVAEMASARGMGILIEPISHKTVPNFFIGTPDLAVQAIEAVGASNVSILLDTYHCAATEIDAARFVRDHPGRVGHVHIADFPGRHEPGTGEIDFEAFLDALDETGYRGAVGFEYIPTAGTEAGLSWIADWRARQAA